MLEWNRLRHLVGVPFHCSFSPISWVFFFLWEEIYRDNRIIFQVRRFDIPLVHCVCKGKSLVIKIISIETGRSRWVCINVAWFGVQAACYCATARLIEWLTALLKVDQQQVCHFVHFSFFLLQNLVVLCCFEFLPWIHIEYQTEKCRTRSISRRQRKVNIRPFHLC